MNKKIAFLTCRDFTGVGSHDDHLLIDYLKNHQIIVKEVIWNEPHDFSEYEMVVVRTPWDYSKHKAHFAKVLKEINKVTKLYNPIDLMLWNMEKVYLKELHQMGVVTIPTLWIPSEKKINFEETCKNLNTKSFILKPSVGAGSSGLIKIEKESDLSLLPSELTSSPLMMAQPFIEGVLEGERSFLYFNNAFSHAIKKVPKNGDFRSQEEFGSTITSFTPTQDELSLCHEILNMLPIKPLYARLDFLPFEGKLLLIELELIEPHLYLSWDKLAPQKIGDEIIKALN